MPSKTPVPWCSPCEPTWMRASAQSTSSPFIQIFSVSCISLLVAAARLMLTTGAVGVFHRIEELCARQTDEIRRSERRHVPRRAGSDPNPVEREQAAVDEDSVDPSERKRRHGAGLEAGCIEDEVGAGDPRLRAARCGGDLLVVC